MNKVTIKKLLFWILAAMMSLSATTALAIDNPDAPDLVGAFNKRALILENAANNPDNGSREYLIAYDDYQTFLDDELNKAYKLLMSKLPKKRQTELKNSQRKWISYRDAEFLLINNNWTRQNFGSSAVISRGTYRCSIIKNRVLQLLYYIKNY